MVSCLQRELDHIKTESFEVYTYAVSLCLCDLIQRVYVISIFRHVYFVNEKPTMISFSAAILKETIIRGMLIK